MYRALFNQKTQNFGDVHGDTVCPHLSTLLPLNPPVLISHHHLRKPHRPTHHLVLFFCSLPNLYSFHSSPANATVLGQVAVNGALRPLRSTSIGIWSLSVTTSSPLNYRALVSPPSTSPSSGPKPSVLRLAPRLLHPTRPSHYTCTFSLSETPKV
ncbi:hypothetical protein VTH06DRAFT_8006 [Thermothelomyces fergusii]